MNPLWPYTLPLDRCLLENVFGCDDSVLRTHYLNKFQALLPESKWFDILCSLMYHLSVEILTSELVDKLSVFRRLLVYASSLSLDMLWINASFACISGSRVVLSGDIFEKFMSGFAIRIPVLDWPCVCSSACVAARAICCGANMMQLGIRALNWVCLENVVDWNVPPIYSELLPVFSLPNRRIEAKKRTLEVVSMHFPESIFPDLYSSAKLFAIVSDCSKGYYSFPVEKVGILGRECRHLMPALGGALLKLLLQTPNTTTGRDSVFKFFIDMKANLSLIDQFAMLRNPQLWEGASPAAMLAELIVWSPKFLYTAAHVCLLCERCRCPTCVLWVGKQAQLAQWMDTVAVSDWKIAYTQLFDLSGTDSRVTDFNGNTILHLVQTECEILAGANSTNVLQRNDYGETALDVAIRECNLGKVRALAKFGGITHMGIQWLCRLANPQVLALLSTTVLGDGWIEEIGRIREEVKTLESYSIEQIEALEEKQTAFVLNLNEKFIREKSAAEHSHTVAHERAQVELETIRRKLTETEAVLAATVLERSEFETNLRKVEKSKSKLDKARKQIESENESRECSLCMEHIWDTALPCGHCYCHQCVLRACANACPTCAKKTAGKFTKLFIFKK